MHATASHHSASTPLAAPNAALPGFEPGAAAASPGLTFAEQLERHAAPASAAPQPADPVLVASADVAGDAPSTDLIAGVGLPGDTPAALRTQQPALRPAEPVLAAAPTRLAATRALAPVSEATDGSGMREFISQVLPVAANPVMPVAAPLVDAALAADVATAPVAEPRQGAVETSSPPLPSTFIPADSVASQTPSLPAPALALAASRAGAPAAARHDERVAVARPTPAPGQPARADLPPGRPLTQLGAMRKGESGADAQRDEVHAADAPTRSPAAPDLAALYPGVDATLELSRDVPRDGLSELGQGAGGAVALGSPPGLVTPPMQPPAEATTNAPSQAGAGGPMRFERFERPAAWPSRYAPAAATNRLPDAAHEPATLPEPLEAGYGATRVEVWPDQRNAPGPGRALDSSAQAPVLPLDVPTTHQAPANPAQEAAASSTVPPGAATLQPSATPVSNAPPLHVELATPLNSPQFRDAFALQVSLLARDGVQHAQVQLNPAELGPISVQIALDGQQAQIHFGCDSAQTRSLVEAGLPALAAALRDAGLTLSGGGVSQHAPGQRHDIEPGRGQRRTADEPDAAAAAPVMRTIRIPNGRLDTYA